MTGGSASVGVGGVSEVVGCGLWVGPATRCQECRRCVMISDAEFQVRSAVDQGIRHDNIESREGGDRDATI